MRKIDMPSLLSNRISVLLVTCIFFISLISQVPYFKKNGISEIMVMVWLIPLPVLVLNGFKNNKTISSILITYSLWFILIILSTLSSENEYIYGSSWSLKSLTMTIYIIIVGYYFSYYLNEKLFIKIITWGALIAAPILAVTVYFDSFQNYDIQSREYGYIGKNSISQILLSCFILIIYLFKPKSIFLNLYKYSVIVSIIVVMLFLKSRASILGYVIIGLIELFVIRDRKTILWMSILLLTLFVYLSVNTELSKTLYYSILLAGRDVSDVNDVSSGRVDILKNAIPSIYNNLWVGSGNNAPFVESFAFSILVQYGLLGSILIGYILSKPVHFSFKYCSWNKPLDLCFRMLLLTYYFNSIFEQQAPLGPGTKCFMLWFVFGFLVYEKTSKYKLESLSKDMRYLRNRKIRLSYVFEKRKQVEPSIKL